MDRIEQRPDRALGGAVDDLWPFRAARDDSNLNSEGQVRIMTTTISRSPGSALQRAPSPTTHDLTNRQLGITAAIVAAILIVAVLALALCGASGIAPASTSFRDMTTRQRGTGRHFGPEDEAAAPIRHCTGRRIPATDGQPGRVAFVTDRMLTGTGRFAADSGAH
jgi:hypothetical protein